MEFQLREFKIETDTFCVYVEVLKNGDSTFMVEKALDERTRVTIDVIDGIDLVKETRFYSDDDIILILTEYMDCIYAGMKYNAPPDKGDVITVRHGPEMKIYNRSYHLNNRNIINIGYSLILRESRLTIQ